MAARRDARAAEVTTDLPKQNIIPYAEQRVQHPVQHPYDELAELIHERGWSKSRIGVEMDAHYYTARCHETLVRGLTDANFANNGDLVNWARLVKSDKEVSLMRDAGKICSQTMNAAIAKIREGCAAK